MSKRDWQRDWELCKQAKEIVANRKPWVHVNVLLQGLGFLKEALEG